MTCFVSEEKIYDHQGKEIVPDENGIIVLQVNKTPRRFVKDKFIKYLEKNNLIIPLPRISVSRTVVAPKKTEQNKIRRERPKKYVIHNVRKVRTDFTRKGTKIKAKKGNKVLGTFISISRCATALGISKSQISKVISGQSTTRTEFKFIKIETNE
jgi:hypothetical protein